MRLHPVGPLLLPHYATEDGIEVGGYSIPKGSTVLFNVSAIMRDPEIWDKPDEFMPERFLQKGELDHYRWGLKGKEFEYTPFGTGTRLCPGLPLAERGRAADIGNTAACIRVATTGRHVGWSWT
uniref:Cytochrome P450 n=1 Tax=Leersia perrieri TaxID=77586 RepID=A0A0D9X4S9_9ORYZ